MYVTRKITNKILAAIEEGTLSAQQVADACLMFMSEQQVADMAHAEEFFLYEDEEADDDDEIDMSDDPVIMDETPIDEILADGDADWFHNAYQQALDGEEPLPPVYTDRDH